MKIDNFSIRGMIKAGLIFHSLHVSNRIVTSNARKFLWTAFLLQSLFQFKHQLDKPHMRDVKQGSAPVYEVTKSHHYREGNTHKSDLKEMHGPIYQQSKHSFSDGYAAPKARR